MEIHFFRLGGGGGGGAKTPKFPPLRAGICVYLFLSPIQCRINHMAEAAYATGPALLGAPRLLSCIFFLKFLFPVLARGPNSAPVRGPKEPKSPRKLELGPNVFCLFPVLVFQRRAPKSPRSSETL